MISNDDLSYELEKFLSFALCTVNIGKNTTHIYKYIYIYIYIQTLFFVTGMNMR